MVRKQIDRVLGHKIVSYQRSYMNSPHGFWIRWNDEPKFWIMELSRTKAIIRAMEKKNPHLLCYYCNSRPCHCEQST